MFEAIDKKKEKLNNKRPLPENTLKSIKESLLVEWTYNSNAIEGNTLTLSETKVVLEGITVGGKSLREHLEVVNHKEAIFYIEDIIRESESLSEWQIKNIHKLILKGIDDQNAGVYRKENVIISGAEHLPPEHILVPQQMESLIKWYYEQVDILHPIQIASILHVLFVKIHPFIDGNGRTARLLMNLELMKNGYPPVVIKKESRLEYYKALDRAHTKEEYADFIALIVNELNNTLELYLKLV